MMIKKKVVISCIGFVALVLIILSIAVELEASPSKETLFPEGQQHALIIFHPSWKYHFQQELTAAFASGLHSAGWAVDRITTSSKNLTEFDRYDLYVFGTNTYYWSPDRPTKRFLSEVNLKGRPSVGLVSGIGFTERSERIMKDLMIKAKASSVDIFSFSLLRPTQNSLIPISNRQVALDSAYQDGLKTGREMTRSQRLVQPEMSPD